MSSSSEPPNALENDSSTQLEKGYSNLPFFTVGIGASAGGLEAFRTFFRHMNENSGMAFVLVSHLAPDRDSMLSELLSKETQMSVRQVKEDTRLEPDRVYVIPPNATMTVDDGILRLSTPTQARGHRAPINVFFRSLAEDQGENAICVILSGTGSDGTIGMKSIKEHGGLAIAQDSGTARYDSMPRNAALTGLVDYVLPVDEMPAKIVEYARHREELREELGEEGVRSQTADYLSQICSLLQRRVGHDFNNYKQGTLIRRIQRRIQITQTQSVEAYVNRLKSDSEEINFLFKDLLIGVTHFFRDPEAFGCLQQTVIKSLVEKSGQDKSIRIWVAGCSSGEEAYSIAMLVSEEMERQSANAHVKIFATDIDERALERARYARYPDSIAEQVSPKQLERFFVEQDGLYQVSKQLREMCIFSQHSLISDPPFSRLDLISCRNLLIYFDTPLQRRLIPLFHYALRSDGYLFLGSSENLSEHRDLFRIKNKPHRIFQRRSTIVPPQVSFPLVDRSIYRPLSSSKSTPRISHHQQFTKSIERVLLQDYAPPCVIINEQDEIVYFFGRTGKYLEPSQGVPSNNLFDLAKVGLRHDLRAAIRAVKVSRKEVTRDRILFETDRQAIAINLIVRPIRDIEDWEARKEQTTLATGEAKATTETTEDANNADTSATEAAENEAAENEVAENEIVTIDERTTQESDSTEESKQQPSSEASSEIRDNLHDNRRNDRRNNLGDRGKSNISAASAQPASGLLMVIFQDLGQSFVREHAQTAEGASDNIDASMVEQLEEELRITKEHLRSTIEELETSNEELKSANEELLSMNEELQSSNEELQTSKEEMQSINEELETVNSELRSKVEELDAANSDVQNLFASTRIATVFLDASLQIKRFTPTATELFHFIGTDIGRPITDLSLPIREEDIVSDVRSVLDSLIPVEREVQIGEEQAFYKMRIMPYRTTDNAISGAVLTFVDVTRLRQARIRAERWAHRQSAIAKIGTYALQSHTALEVCDRAVQVVRQTLNADLCSLFVVQPDRPNRLLLKSGSGWRTNSVGVFQLSTDSQVGYTLDVQQPVVTEDFAKENRFQPSSLLQKLGVASGVCTVVYGTDKPFGVLAIHKKTVGKYAAEDTSFLQSVANVLAATLQRERTVEALNKSRERLDLAIDAGKMGIWELDIPTGSVTWNQVEYELIGFDPSEARSPDLTLFYQNVYPEDIEPVQQALEQAIAGETEFNSEFRISHPKKGIRWIAAKARVVYDTDGNATKAFGVNYDITERKQNEEALRAADRRKDDFLATLSHELRNPLNALNGSISLLQRLISGEELDQLAKSDRNKTAPGFRQRAQHLYAVANRQLHQLNRLVDELLDVSRIAHRKIQLDRQPIDLLQLLKDLVADMHNVAADKEIAIDLRLPDAPIWINGDKIRLTQAFSNILQNAIKFSQRGSQVSLISTIEAKREAKPNAKQVVVQVVDSGIGIEANVLPRIFTAFSQEDHSQEDRSLSQQGGLGLGLPLARGIIDLHGGKVWANSAGRGKGTTITVTLDVLEASSSVPIEMSRQLLGATSKRSAQATEAARTSLIRTNLDRPHRILIVEDNQDSATMTQFFLEGLGYQVAMAADGPAGLALARQFKPDAIVSDIGLTKAMDGYSLALAIREDPALDGAYLIAVSGYGQPEDKARAKAVGFDRHLTKPVELGELEAVIAQALSRN